MIKDLHLNLGQIVMGTFMIGFEFLQKAQGKSI